MSYTGYKLVKGEKKNLKRKSENAYTREKRKRIPEIRRVYTAFRFLHTYTGKQMRKTGDRVDKKEAMSIIKYGELPEIIV